MKSIMKLSLLSLLALFLSACGGGTPAPVNAEGTWVDEDAVYSFCDMAFTEAVTFNLDQNGNDLSGTVRFVYEGGEDSYDDTWDLTGSVTNSGDVTAVLTFPGGPLTYEADLQVNGDLLTGELVSRDPVQCEDGVARKVVEEINARRQ